MRTNSLLSFGLNQAEAKAADNRAAVAARMPVSKSAEVRAWSTVLNKGASSKPKKSDTGDVDKAADVLGPDDHTEFMDEAVEASTQIRMPAPVRGRTKITAMLDEAVGFNVAFAKVSDLIKAPVAKVTGLKRRTRKGVVERVLTVGKDEIVINPLDWAGVLGVMTGKMAKAVVNGTWGFGKAGSEDIIRIRNLKAVATGEISVKALNKLI